MAETKRQRYERLRQALRLERSSFIAHWRDLNDYILPRRGRFYTSDVNKGDRRNLKIIDSTATLAARTLRAGMTSGVTSPARPWFRLTTPDPELAEFGPVKTWLDDVRQRMSTVFLRSNLYRELPTIYADLGVFGTACMALMEDDEAVIRAFDFPVGSYMIANDERLRVRVFVREFRMTVRQLVRRFGQLTPRGLPDWSRFSPRVRNLYERGDLEEWIDLVHVVDPNVDYRPDRASAAFKAFSSCYYEQGAEEGRFLEESGFDEFPILAPRWETTGEDVYGTACPGMEALGDIKQLQHGEKRAAQGIDKLVSPPMVAPPAMKSQRLSTLPGDVSYVQESQVQTFRPAYQVDPKLDALENKQAQVRYRIQRAFYEDLFLMLAQSDRREITAREVEERHEEKLLALGPVLEQLNQDLLDPLIDRTFAVMVRRALVPDPPQELQGMPLRVEYISIMAQAQKLVGLSGLERFAGFATQLASVDPAVLDKVNRDEMLTEYGDMTGIGPRILVPDEQVQAIRQARAQQQAAQAAAERAAQLAPAAQQLSETDVERPSALRELIDAGALGTGSLAGVA